MKLKDLKPHQNARVRAVHALRDDDMVAVRLKELGFVAGEPIRLLGTGPLGHEPLLVGIGSTRFALRHLEADRIEVELVA